MKSLLVALATLTLGTQAAQAFEIKLPCRDNKGQALAIIAVKAPFKTESGKWDYRLLLEAGGQRFELVSAESGDEDYNEFKVPGAEAIGIQGAYVQNHFEWVGLINMDGSAFAQCRK